MTLFNMHGAEHDAVLATDNGNIWTLIDADDGMALHSGDHHVRRMGSFITEVAHTGADIYFVIETVSSETSADGASFDGYFAKLQLGSLG